MKTLIETLFELLITLAKGVFELICFIFQVNSNEKLYDHSQMLGKDKRKLFSRFNKGIIVNGKKRISIKQSLTHVLIVGKSGSGKTSSIYKVALLTAKNENFVITDLDGDLLKTCSGHLAQKGYNIQVLDLNNVSLSAFFCPLSYCETIDELKALAEQIILSSGASKGSSDQFWNYSASNLLFLLFRLIKTQPTEYQNLTNVLHLLNLFESDGFKEFVSCNTEGTLFDDYLSFISKDIKLRTSILATLGATLSLFSYNDIAYVTSKNTIDFKSLTRKTKQALFIIVPERLLIRNSLFLSTFYASLFNYFQKNKPIKPVTVLLDECGNFYLVGLDILSSILRRYSTCLIIAVQSISQLRKLYGIDACNTILSNMSTKIIFPGASLELASEISKISGQKSVEILFEGKIRQQIKPVLTPTEVIQMKQNRALFLISNFPPVILKMFPYFKQFTLKRRSKLKPVELESNPIIIPRLIKLSKTVDDEEN